MDETEELIRREHAAKRPQEPFGLFAIQHPAPSAPRETSENAADALQTPSGRIKRETVARRILGLIASREAGYSSPEIEEAGYYTGTVCARVDDLRFLGLIETSETIRRRSKRGHDASVHFVLAKGRRVVDGLEMMPKTPKRTAAA